MLPDQTNGNLQQHETLDIWQHKELINYIFAY